MTSDEGRPFRDVAGRVTGPLDRGAWDDRWVRGDTPWDMAQPAPPLVQAVERGLVAGRARVLVPGCGAGHDARFLAARGFDVTAVDISAAALARARAMAEAEGARVAFVEADLFALPPELGTFDVVWEHTCFCAIDPSRRDDYVRAVADALRPGGRLLGLFFDIRPETGPPFGTSAEEIRHRFGARFDAIAVSPAADSHPSRLGRELFAVMERR
jgi:SAM-dependent methyltransferase